MLEQWGKECDEVFQEAGMMMVRLADFFVCRYNRFISLLPRKVKSSISSLKL